MTLEVFGCTQETALNYNIEATTDDGSCQIEGCMDVEANNYNPISNMMVHVYLMFMAVWMIII